VTPYPKILEGETMADDDQPTWQRPISEWPTLPPEVVAGAMEAMKSPRPITEGDLRRAGFVPINAPVRREGVSRKEVVAAGSMLYRIFAEETPNWELSDPIGPFTFKAMFVQGGMSVWVEPDFAPDETLDQVEAWFAMAYDRLECSPIGAVS